MVVVCRHILVFSLSLSQAKQYYILNQFLLRALGICQPPFLGIVLLILVLLLSLLETYMSPFIQASASRHSSTSVYQYYQGSPNWNWTLIKFLVLVIFFTGVFRTTCGTEETSDAGQ